MLSTPSLLGSLCPGVVASEKVISIGQIELFDCLNPVQTNALCQIELFEIELFDHLILCKQMIDV